MMEADSAGGVYRVSHVDDGKFTNLLRPCHVEHYDFAFSIPILTSISSAEMMIEVIF
jgi:hypothetical protein